MSIGITRIRRMINSGSDIDNKLKDKEIEKYRCFLAVDLPDEVKRVLKSLEDFLEGVKTVPVHQMHLTIRFLGDVEKKRLHLLNDELKEIRLPRFKMNINGVGFFPGMRNPRVVWAGVEENAHLQKLYDLIEDKVTSFGLKPEKRDFKPHITLGRVKYLKKKVLREFISRYQEIEINGIEVNDFILFRSILSENGAKHLAIEKYHLQETKG